MTDLTLAREIAIDAKSDPFFHLDDIGLYCDVPAARGLPAAAFEALCEEVERLIPIVEADPAKTAAWHEASRDVARTRNHELTHLGV